MLTTFVPDGQALVSTKKGPIADFLKIPGVPAGEHLAYMREVRIFREISQMLAKVLASQPGSPGNSQYIG